MMSSKKGGPHMNDKWLLAISALVVAFVLVGQVVTYWANPYHYGADVEISEGEIVFSVHAPTSEFYALAYDNGGFESVTEIYVFIDAGYCSGQSMSDQNKFLGQLTRELEIRGFPEPIAVDAAGLSSLMSGPGNGKGVLMLSGAFPDTVYSGSAGDAVFSWLESTGSIFWMNGRIGHLVSHDDGTTTALNGTDILFFGMDGAVRTSKDSPIGKERGQNRDIGEMLCVNYGVRAGDVTNGLSDRIGGKTLSIGFSDEDGYGSTTLTDCGKGKGMIAVFGGGLNGDTRVAAAQVISSGVSYNIDADEVGFQTGVVKGTYSGSLGPADQFTDVYVFLGKINTLYGELFKIEAAGA